MLSMLIVMSMLLSLLPLSAFSAGTEGSEAVTDTQSQMLYSDETVHIDASGSAFPETDGSQTVTLIRTENLSSEKTYTVLLYDNSANYGEDYRLWYGDTLIAKREGATSVYDAFRDNGEETSGLGLDLELTATNVLEQQSDETVNAADMLCQLDELGALAAKFSVCFAPGQKTAELTLELLDDSESEYEEIFLIAVLDAEGYVIEDAQLVCSITDDEPAPSVEVSFDCVEELELNAESGEAELVFKRSGDLATSTLVALYCNGEPMGWVDFAPWQKTQTAWVVAAGVYTMTDAEGIPLDGAVTVADNTPATLNVAVEGADPVLDAVPDSYNALPAMRRSTKASWMPDWAQGGSYENASEIVVMGSTSNNLFKVREDYLLGKATFLSGGENYHDLNTSGTGSGINIGWVNILTKSSYDLTGIESVTTYVKTSGVDLGADMDFYVYTKSEFYRGDTKRIKDDGYYTFTVKLDDKYQASRQIGFENEDYTNFTRGCHAYVPNGFKMNKRTYCFQVDNSKATPLYYEGSTAVEGVLPTVDGNDSRIFVTMGNGDENRVNLVYSYEKYPAVLTGFKLYNPETKATSGVISLSTGNSGSCNGGTQSNSSFLFTREFLKKYEGTYCWLGTVNNAKQHMFTIIPVYEKMPVSYTIEASAAGSIKLENKTLYRGDVAVFSDTGASEATLSGVWFTAQSDLSGVTKSGTMDADSDGKVRIMMNADYSKYTFEGVYDSRADQLLVYLGKDQAQYGSLNFKEGAILQGSSYVKDEYYPLMAKPKDGYIAKWVSGGREFYGNTFYYKLDGNAAHNMIYLYFEKADSVGMVTKDLTGILSITDVDLRTKFASSLRMANTTLFVTSDTTYQAFTNAQGEFCIEGFRGIPGETYSVMVSYADTAGYATFVFEESGICNITMPQFTAGMAFPDSVSVTLDGTSGTSNMIQLRNESNVTVSARVYAPADSVEVQEVYFHFMSNPILKSDGTYGSTEKLVLQAYAYTTPDDENYSYWSVTVPAAELTGNTNLYISVVSEATVLVEDKNGMSTTVMTVNSGKVNGGYAFISPITDTSIPVHYDIPSTPSVQDAESIDLQSLGIPLVGNLDIKLSSLTGGFFVQRTDPNTGDTILVCGHSFTTIYGTGNITDKMEAAKKTHDAIMNTAANSTPAGSSDTAVSAASKGKAPSPVTFSPVFMFKLVVSPDADGGPGHITAYEMALGIDAFYFRNIPFNVSGVPLYVALSFNLEAYMSWALSIDPGVDSMGELIELFGKLAIRDEAAEAQTEDQMFFAAPMFKFGAKGGAGYNSFLSLFVELTVSAPFIIQAHPSWDAAVKFGFEANAGADLLVFTGKIPMLQEDVYLGEESLKEDLKLITAQTVAASARSASAGSASAASEAALPDLNELFNSITFSPATRLNSVLRTAAGAGTVASNAFINTQVQLTKLEDGKILAFFLKDTQQQDTMNYLSVACAISSDGGKTWGDIQYLDDRTNSTGSSLQYDINIFELQDRLLVTWSEADLDRLISEMDLDVENLTASQVGKLMAAMNLKGVFLDKTNGAVISEPFLIARNSTVACGALDAVQNGDMVYIYYQRNAVPETDEMTLMELVSLERTIAMARINVNAPDECISTPVRAMGESGQQYRITDVEPFVHDGVMGEVLVLDQDGKLANYDASTGSWTASIEDRQLYLRTYDLDPETGEPIPTALMAITDYSVCAQSPQVVSDDQYLHLFWNQDGEVVYITDFVATENDHPAVQENAYVVRNASNAVAAASVPEYYANGIAASDRMHVGTTFTASMAEDGRVLLCWVAEEPDSQSLLPTDEVYGVLLNTISNADAVRQSDKTGYELAEGNEYLYQLEPVGSPVALTDENGLIGALDSICLESGDTNKFLLAFTKLNSQKRSTATAVDIMTTHSQSVPDLEITEVIAPEYPTPGSDMSVYVTVTNNGIETAQNVVVNASGIGNGGEAVLEELLPGCTEILTLTVTVPEDFSKTTELNIQADCSNGDEPRNTFVEVKYGAHFVPVDVPVMTALFNSADCLTVTTVKNIGNASGTPTVSFLNTIYGSEEEGKEYTCASDVEVVPGGETAVTYLLEDTLMNDEKTAYLTVSLGEEYDQSVQSFMPVPVYSSINGSAEASPQISEIVEAVNGYDQATVTSDDKTDIEKLVEEIDTLLAAEAVSEEERQLLNVAKVKAEALLEIIRKAAEAIQTESIQKVKDITAQNAASKHKADLTKARSDFENALKAYGGNYTKAEKKAIESNIKRINEALDAISRSTEGGPPKTGDPGNMVMWVALLGVSCGAIVTLIAKRKKVKAAKL